MQRAGQLSLRAPLFLLCFLVLFAGAVGIGGAGPKSSTKTGQNSKTVTVTEEESGSQISLARGATLIVRLEVTSGTGYSWLVAKDGAPQLKATGKPYTEKPKDSKPGAAVVQVFRFRAVQPGAAGLELHYQRAWEKDKPPARTFTLELNIP
jgi:inhibitor of cysteine peptidase